MQPNAELERSVLLAIPVELCFDGLHRHPDRDHLVEVLEGVLLFHRVVFPPPEGRLFLVDSQPLQDHRRLGPRRHIALRGLRRCGCRPGPSALKGASALLAQVEQGAGRCLERGPLLREGHQPFEVGVVFIALELESQLQLGSGDPKFHVVHEPRHQRVLLLVRPHLEPVFLPSAAAETAAAVAAPVVAVPQPVEDAPRLVIELVAAARFCVP
mmetsp:Transcript_10923/g.25589  ORF Transcript_10923/g.25589 Transcript_10923/m.25589 type:complete len:213 (+) Transcript_10923:800-1438(+)